MSTHEQRLRMAETIKNFEARRDRKGRLQVYYLPPGDGGGKYEVAGINQRYNKQVCDRLVALVNAGRHDEAEALATEFIANDTDPVESWSTIPAIESYLRDCCFNRGARGAAAILQLAVGVDVDGRVGKETRKALDAADDSPAVLLRALRSARETYERSTYPWKRHARDERSKFWKGLVNRWNKALAAARKFPMTSGPEPTLRPAPQPTPRPAPSSKPAPSRPVPDDWRLLRKGRRGADVKAWQKFLNSRGINPGPIDGIFGPRTFAATQAFQRKYRLQVDGIAGPETFGKAIAFGYQGPPAADTRGAPKKKQAKQPPAELPPVERASSKTPLNLPYPAKPDFPPLVSTNDRERVFGHFAYLPAPTRAEPRAIRIIDNWERNNIVNVPIPQLRKTALGSRAPRTMRFHRLAATQLRGLWADWEAANLLDRILDYEGAFTARFIGGTHTLSNHAFGSAFDINVPYNPYHRKPARPNEKGCVYELVPIAHRWGFYWGGHFSRRSIDGMHFEVAVIKD